MILAGVVSFFWIHKNWFLVTALRDTRYYCVSVAPRAAPNVLVSTSLRDMLDFDLVRTSIILLTSTFVVIMVWPIFSSRSRWDPSGRVRVSFSLHTKSGATDNGRFSTATSPGAQAVLALHWPSSLRRKVQTCQSSHGTRKILRKP
jgi:hypothetical protein